MIENVMGEIKGFLIKNNDWEWYWGDEGINRKKKYKEPLLFAKEGDKNWERQRIHINPYKFRKKILEKKNIEKYYLILLKKI